MTRKMIDRMIRELANELDDLAKSLDPDLTEEPDDLPERMSRLRRIVEKHLVTK